MVDLDRKTKIQWRFEIMTAFVNIVFQIWRLREELSIVDSFPLSKGSFGRLVNWLYLSLYFENLVLRKTKNS